MMFNNLLPHTDILDDFLEHYENYDNKIDNDLYDDDNNNGQR